MAKEEFAAFLGAETNYNGQLNFSGRVQIHGQFTGEIKSDGTLNIGEGAKVEGTIQVGQLDMSGKLHGDVVVTGKTILRKSANLTGNLITKALIMEEGALLQGTISMGASPESLIKPSLGKVALVDSDVRDVDLQ